MELNDTDLEKDKPNDKINDKSNKSIKDFTNSELLICIITLPFILVFGIIIFIIALILMIIQFIFKNINYISIGIIIILGFMLLKKYYLS